MSDLYNELADKLKDALEDADEEGGPRDLPWAVVPMQRTPAGVRPFDEDKRCDRCEGYGWVDIGPFRPGNPCPACDKTGMVEPWQSRQEAVSAIRDQVEQLDWSEFDQDDLQLIRQFLVFLSEKQQSSVDAMGDPDDEP